MGKGRNLAEVRPDLTLQDTTLWHHDYCLGWTEQHPQKLPRATALQLVGWHCRVQHVGINTSAVCFASWGTWSPVCALVGCREP